MTLNHPRLFLIILFVLLTPFRAGAAGNFVFKGQIVDTANKPVAGAEVYVFNSSNVKRPADFISNRTGNDGNFQVEIPPGHYWTMAILRVNGASFGPLGKDDKHSGEPTEIDSAARDELINDFTVMDLREAARANQKRSETTVRISGRIVNDDGLPVEMAYVMADRQQKFVDLPQYFSTWTDVDGSYVIFLPQGDYFLGASKDFPPDNDYCLPTAENFPADADNIDLVIPSITR